MTHEDQPHRTYHEYSKATWKELGEITSPTQAAKALQTKVLGNERSDLLSATIFFYSQREKERNHENSEDDYGYATCRREFQLVTNVALTLCYVALYIHFVGVCVCVSVILISSINCYSL